VYKIPLTLLKFPGVGGPMVRWYHDELPRFVSIIEATYILNRKFKNVGHHVIGCNWSVDKWQGILLIFIFFYWFKQIGLDMDIVPFILPEGRYLELQNVFMEERLFMPIYQQLLRNRLTFTPFFELTIKFYLFVAFNHRELSHIPWTF
jgi:hypothetical protein